jgi:hypothetical protein
VNHTNLTICNSHTHISCNTAKRSLGSLGTYSHGNFRTGMTPAGWTGSPMMLDGLGGTLVFVVDVSLTVRMAAATMREAPCVLNRCIC